MLISGRPVAGRLSAAKISMEQASFGLAALAALLPATMQGLRREPRRDAMFWVWLALAVVGPTMCAIALSRASWQTGFGAALWVSVAATMVAFALTTAITSQSWRLAPLVGGYMLILGSIATTWQRAIGQPLLEGFSSSGWMTIHIMASLATYGVVTVAAIAALAAVIQERALKRRQPSRWTRALPSVADCESLLVGLLKVGEAILALGLLSGMALQYQESGSLLVFNHKTILTIAAFLVIAALLFAYHAYGVRGRRAARGVLIAYLLMTLGYPGVKFVTDVLMA
jgi:ABC-type uncharacterized transport system permease subunit